MNNLFDMNYTRINTEVVIISSEQKCTGNDTFSDEIKLVRTHESSYYYGVMVNEQGFLINYN